MTAEPTDRLPWPRFVLTAIPYPPGTPEAACRALDAAGVPVRCVGYEYVVLECAQRLEKHPNLLAFGRSGLNGRICLDVVSLEVVHVPVPDYDPQINPVNSSLPAFIACVEAAISQFPYDSGDDEDDDQRLEAVSSLRARLLAIDPRTGSHNGLWEGFLDDVLNYDYGPEQFEPPKSAASP
jgi:hypothetical protein